MTVSSSGFGLVVQIGRVIVTFMGADFVFAGCWSLRFPSSGAHSMELAVPFMDVVVKRKQH